MKNLACLLGLHKWRRVNSDYSVKVRNGSPCGYRGVATLMCASCWSVREAKSRPMESTRSAQLWCLRWPAPDESMSLMVDMFLENQK